MKIFKYLSILLILSVITFGQVTHKSQRDANLHMPFMTWDATPEGALEGDINDFCMDTVNAVLYWKATGDATNTGWLIFTPTNVVDGDYGEITVASGVWTIDDDVVDEPTLKAVNEAVDEDIFTYESSTGDFEWHTPAELGIVTSESDPLALLTADTDNVKDTHVDWGVGANQVSAVDVPIADAGVIITATEVEGALQENRIAIDLNTAKDTNVPTALSEGTRAPTTYGITSDGGTDDIVLPEANTTNAGLLGADKWDEIVVSTTHSGLSNNPHTVTPTQLSLVIGTNVQAWDTDLDTWAGVTPSANGQSLVSSANYALMRGLLDLEAGTDFYSKSAEDTWRNSVTQTEMGYLNGISLFGSDLIDDADASAGRTTLGLENLTNDAQLKIASNLSDVAAQQTALDNITNVGGATNEHVLTKDTGTGNAVWKVASSGFTDPMTTRGDIIIKDASNNTERLGIGANTFVLTSDGTDISWTASASGGNVSTSGTPVVNDFAKFINGTDIEGRNYTETKQDLSLDNVTNVAISGVAYDATTWDGNSDGADKNSIRDKIESLAGGHDPVTLNASATAGGMSIAAQEISNRAATNSQTGYMTSALVGNIETNNAKVGVTTEISNLVEDGTPQLGGALDGQGNDLNNLGVIFMTEQAADESSVTGKLQLWTKTATPNQLWWTDDGNNEREGVYSGGAFHDGFSDFVGDEHLRWDLSGIGTIHTDNYIENVSTALSEGTRAPTTYGITSDGGTDDIVLPEANTTNAGLLGADKWDEIVASTTHSGLSNNPHTVTPTQLSLVIGTNVQAWDTDLDTWAGVTPSANGQSLVSSANYASMRGLLDLEAGTDFYSKSAEDTWRNSVTQTEMGYVNGLTDDAQNQLNTKMEDFSDDATPTAGGTVVMADNNLTGIGSAGFTQELDLGSKTTDFSVDFGTDQKQKVTLTANTMIMTFDTTFDRVGSYQLTIINGGLATLTWASESGTLSAKGGEPTLTASGKDIVACYYDGTNWSLFVSTNLVTF